MASARILGPRRAVPLGGRWEVARLPPGSALDPQALDARQARWIRSESPLPVAAALRAAGEGTSDRMIDLDADDWWYRCRFSAGSGVRRMTFGGLATIADVWLNGRLVLQSDNMFLAHIVELDGAIRPDNELLLRFHALAPLLAPKRPRPRWRAQLVSHQALRWYRTSLLGRMPGWCPPIAPVGPWRPISLESSAFAIERAAVHARIDGEDGVVSVDLQVRTTDGARAGVAGAVSVGNCTQSVTGTRRADGSYDLSALVRVPRPERWWPHTHGRPALYGVRASLGVDSAAEAVDLGGVGFRTLQLDRGTDGQAFGLVLNGVPVFCRGVCWTPLDLHRLLVDESAYRTALERLRDGGINMIRVPGTMTYEADAFHDLCDELGILVWQDLMFASMDYPWTDEGFRRSATLEAAQVLRALQSRPSLAVVCGNSEVDQQAAMFGLDAATRSNPAGDESLGALAREIAPDAVWLPTTPIGGTFPFQVNSGVSHYYGVGAYRRPLDDARRAGVRFAAECLAFSNVPDEPTVALVLSGRSGIGHDPRWKARVPRDRGAAWDFEEVRDHYVERLFGVPSLALRSRDPERYLTLGRIATAEAMLRTFAEWRRPGSTCRGALVWLAQDLEPGAGWGIVDSTGRPKAAYWYLKRALAPIALLFADEGLNGLWLHVVNDSVDAVAGNLQLTVYRDGLPHGAPDHRGIHVAPRGFASLHVDALAGGFRDLTDAYRFGPRAHDLVAATLRDRATGTLLADACYFPGTLPPDERDIGLAARVEPAPGGFALYLETRRFAHAVSIGFDQFTPDDNYVSVEPGQTRCIRLAAQARGAAPRGSVSALNGRAISVAAEPVDVT